LNRLLQCLWMMAVMGHAALAAGETSFVAEGAKVTKLAGDMKFTEGPVWLPADKKLVFSDIPNSQWMQWTEDGGVSVYRASEQANGNILDLQGRLVSCQHSARNLVRIEEDGKITVLADKFDGKRFNSPNDVAVRSDGTLWFTDPPWGLTEKGELPGHFVFKLDPKTCQVEAVIKDLAMPNGIVFSPDESRLYVADTGGNARHPDPAFHKLAAGVHCYEVGKDGQLGKKLFTIPDGSDGLKVDAQGNLYTTHDKVKIYDPAGKLLEQIDVPEAPANLCFGGDDYKTLFITARTSLYSVRMANPGVKPAGALRAGKAAASYYLIGNSLTWDTVPQRLDGDVQWHVDCGVSLPYIFAKPDQPCVKESTVWTQALRDKQYDIVSVQPHYGSTLAQDVETISTWMKLQPNAVFVVHSGWAFHAQREIEFASLATPDQMSHSPHYFRALVAELRRLHPNREIRQTLAQNLLTLIAEDIATGRAPIKAVAELYRDPIHMTHDHGKYLMHNAMRRALGQPLSAAGFENLHPEVKLYLDGVLALLTTASEDLLVLRRVLSNAAAVDRPALVAKLSDEALRARVTALLPEIERAALARNNTQELEARIAEVGGRLICTSSAPQWLTLTIGDLGTEVFDVPTIVDLYNGNNPLKGKGGRNEKVTDAWIECLSGTSTLRRIDLANCEIKGEGLRHLSGLTALRELNLTLTPVTDEALQHLAGLTELRMLGLASTQCTGTGFMHLQGLKKLENVNFHFTPLNDDGLRAITQVPISDRLWFAHTKFTDAGAASLSNLTQLKRCGIGSTDKASSGEAVAALVKLPLEDLALLDNQATPAGLAYAAKIDTLRRLDVSHAPTVTDESLRAVGLMSALEEFKLGNANVTDEGLMGLVASTSLKRLSLTGLKQVTPAGLERLRKARPELQIEVK